MDCRYPQEPSRWEQCWKMASEIMQVFAKSWFGGDAGGTDAEDHKIAELGEGTVRFRLTVREGCYNRKK